MAKKRHIFMLIALSVLSGCAEAYQVDFEAERIALVESVEAYYNGLSDLQADVAEMYADDALVLRPGRAELTGRPALDEFVIGINQTPGFDVGFDTRFVEMSEDATVGYSLAIVRVASEGENGERILEQNRDLHVWKKDENGRWRLVVDIWNDLPAED